MIAPSKSEGFFFVLGRGMQMMAMLYYRESCRGMLEGFVLLCIACCITSGFVSFHQPLSLSLSYSELCLQTRLTAGAKFEREKTGLFIYLRSLECRLKLGFGFES